MQCKFCGVEVEEGSAFCPVCGKRIDGKKACIGCGTMIPEDTVFCAHCGTRVDGKKICKNCGAEVTDAFCVQCGTPYGEEKAAPAKEAPVKAKAAKPANGGWAKVAGILMPAITLTAMSILFICSFCIGLTAPGESVGMFDYFFDSIWNRTDILNTLPNVVVMLSLLLNLGVSTALLIVAIVKFAKGMKAEKTANLMPYAVWSFATFVFASFSAVLHSGYSGYGYTVGLSAGSIAGIVLGTLLLFSVIVINMTAKGKALFNAKFIVRSALSVVGFVFIMVTMFILTSNAVAIGGMKMSPGMNIQQSGGSDYYGLPEVMAVFMWLFAVVVAVFYAFYLRKTMRDFTAEKPAIGVKWNVLTLVFSFVYLLCAVIFSTDWIGGGAKIVGPILVFVFALFMLGITIANKIIAKKENQAQINQ